LQSCIVPCTSARLTEQLPAPDRSNETCARSKRSATLLHLGVVEARPARLGKCSPGVRNVLAYRLLGAKAWTTSCSRPSSSQRGCERTTGLGLILTLTYSLSPTPDRRSTKSLCDRAGSSWVRCGLKRACSQHPDPCTLPRRAQALIAILPLSIPGTSLARPVF
jgi:hypothetical protein